MEAHFVRHLTFEGWSEWTRCPGNEQEAEAYYKRLHGTGGAKHQVRPAPIRAGL